MKRPIQVALVALAALGSVAWWTLSPDEAPSAAKGFRAAPDLSTEAAAAPGAAPRPESAGPYWSEAEAALAAGELERAEELLEGYLGTQAPAAAVYELFSTLARRRADLATAVDYAERAVELEPDRSMAHVSLTRALREQMAEAGMMKAMLSLGRLKETMARAIELDPDNVEALVDQAFFLLYAPSIAGGDLDGVRELIARLEGLDPIEAVTLEVLLLQREEQRAASLDRCRAALAEHPQSQSLHFTLGLMLADGGGPEQERESSVPNAEDTAAAEEAFRNALAGPDVQARHNAQYQLAKLLIEDERDYEEALAFLDAYLIGVRCDDLLIPAAAAQWRRGTALERLGRMDEAEAAYAEALRLDPDFERAREAMGVLKERG